MTQEVRVYWVGPARNRVWDLRTGSSGVVLDGGLTGQHFPDFTPAVATPARKNGRIYQATRFDARKVTLKVLVGDPVWAPVIRTGDRWRDLDDEWNSSLSETLPGRLCFITNHGYRWLDARVDDASEPENVNEPGKIGMVRYEYVLASDDAFYSGFTQRFTVFSGAEGKVSGRVFNRGQYDTYPVVVFTGPGTFTFGAGDRWTQLPTLYAGQSLTIDTDPDVLTVKDQAGVNRRPDLPRGHDLSFALPAGGSVELSASVVNGTPGSKVVAKVSPKYRRAW